MHPFVIRQSLGPNKQKPYIMDTEIEGREKEICKKTGWKV